MGGEVMARQKVTQLSERPLPVCPLINAMELAAYLGISPRSIRRLTAEGKIPAPLRFCGSPRWNIKDVNLWVLAGCPNSKTDEAVAP